MRIVYLHQYFVFPSGTGGTRSYDLSSGFKKHGIEVEVVTSSAFIDEIKNNFVSGWNILEEDGIRFHILKLDYSNNLSYFRRILVFLQFIWYASFRLLSIECDLVLATSTPLTIGIPAMVKKMIHKTPYIFEVRDVWPEAVIAIGAIKNRLIQKLLYWLEYLIYRNAKGIVPLSPDMLTSIVSRYPELKSKPIKVIENISEIERFQKGFNPSICLIREKIGFKPRFTVLYAGTFGRVNGIEYVINLASKTLPIDSGIVFVLIGSGSEEASLKARAKHAGVLNKNVFFLEPIPKNQLAQLYYEVDLGSSFVIPITELWANSANKFFDSLASGKPILINYGGWQKGLIKQENVGYVLPPVLDRTFNVQNFISFTTDFSALQQQRKNALRLAKLSYSLQTAIYKYLKLFEEIGLSNELPINEVQWESELVSKN